MASIECQSKNSKIEHAGPNAPEMFTVYRPIAGRKSTECLNHAAASEARGNKADIILT